MKDAVVIRIDGGLKSDLLWKEEKETARKYVEKGYRIFWELDFGIFSKLKYPLSHATQFMSLKLSADHFRNAFWKEFEKSTIGVSLYRGSLDFTKEFLWDQEQEKTLQSWLQDQFESIENLNKEISSEYNSFSNVDHLILSNTEAGTKLLQIFCRDVTAEYFNLLLNQLPGELPAYLMLNTNEIKDRVHQANLLSKEHFADFFIVSDSNLTFEKKQPPKIAICLPSLTFFKPSDYEKFRKAFNDLSEKEVDYKIIPEALLTSEWDGLDQLLVSEEHMSPQGKRMMMGFCAAGGTITEV